MYQILATKMSVGTSGEVTQAVSMAGTNAVVVEMTVISGTVAQVALQGSNDLENWALLSNGNLVTSGTLASGGAYYLPGTSSNFGGPITGVATQYVRLKITASSGTAVVAAGLNTSAQ